MNTSDYIALGSCCLLGACVFGIAYGFFIYLPRVSSPTIPNPPAPPESSVDDNWEWMTTRFPIGARIDYLNRVLLVGRHDDDDDGFYSSLCEYADDKGRIREITISLDQLKAIAKRDEPKIPASHGPR